MFRLAEMSKVEVINFLNHGTMTAKISTASLDGTPHVAPVWFMIDDKKLQQGSITDSNLNLILLFTTSNKSVKAKHLIENPKISVCVDDQKPPFSFIIINGIVEIEHNPLPDDLLGYTTKLAERYMGKENSVRFGKRNAVEGELIVRVRPKKIIAQKNVSE